MRNYLNIAQIAIAVLLMAAILLQSRGSGLGSAFGGGDGNVSHTKRGVEKSLHITTIVLAVAFFALSLLAIFLPNGPTA